MPLRDHFRSPLDDITAWEGFHGGWPMVIVQKLATKLPAQYVAAPRVHSGGYMEIDIATYDTEDAGSPSTRAGQSNGGVATAVWAPAQPTLVVETELPDADEYEVRVFDTKRGRRLVAAIEIVSPANKDRPEHRRVFVAKCAALLQQRVAVSIIDLVTVRDFNLYADLLELLGQRDPSLSSEPPPLYAVSCRWRPKDNTRLLEAWHQSLTLGQPLPTLPLWLTATFAVPLELEESYEQTCRDLRIA
jgi:Protein of unknown function (DUF4058)